MYKEDQVVIKSKRMLTGSNTVKGQFLKYFEISKRRFKLKRMDI
ncbi:MAG: hypothetical protein ACJA1A_000984 [Saprospiraceae bacterium]|jgi:hypothetical protein